MWAIAVTAPFAFAQAGGASAAAPTPTAPSTPSFPNRALGRGVMRTQASPATNTAANGAAAGGAAGATATTPAAGAAGANGATAGSTPAAGGKASADTDKLPQFEQGVEFEPRGPNYKVAFSLEDADLNELVRVIAQLTGKRFIFGGKVRNIKTSVYSPQKVTVAEAYQAFLSILETNGLTVIPQGRFLKIVETGAIASENTPVYGPNQPEPAEDRFVTRMLRLKAGNADELAGVLAKFKSKEGAVEAYAPGNLLIITDTGAQIHRMQTIIDQIDVGGSGDQIWIEPIHYAAASDIQKRIDDLFDIKSGSSSSAPPAGGKGAAPSGSGGGELHVTKIIADDRTNSLLIVATEKAYLRMLEIIKRMDVPQSEGGEIHVLPLQHADAVELTKTLGEIVTGANAVAKQGDPSRGGTGGASSGTAAAAGIFEGGVKVSADKATNSLVVTSSLRDYAALHAVVDRLDQARRQVFIEAVIMDLSITRSNQFGVNFHAADAPGFGADGQGLVYGGLNPLKTILLPDPTTLQGLALGVRGPGIPGSENLLGTGLSIPAFGVTINALASSTDADVLSTPHILATDNIVAEINVGENIPLQTNLGLSSALGGTGSSAAGGLGALGALGGLTSGTGARQDVGTKIKITPHLNDSNEVRLELAEEISEAQAPQGNAGVVPITKRTANTQLTVGDQQTVVIGGLMRNRVTHSQQKIPLLGDIPVLGALFRSTQNDMQKTNLILILTPYIIREQTDLRTIFERKMQERQEFLDRYFVFSDEQEYQAPKDYSRTNGLAEVIRQAYLDAEEKKRLEELTGPRPMVGHEPTEPIQMPTSPRSSVSAAAASSGAPAGTNTPPPPVQTGIPPRVIQGGMREVEH
jgi:general secretion pathway protein D